MCCDILTENDIKMVVMVEVKLCVCIRYYTIVLRLIGLLSSYQEV